MTEGQGTAIVTITRPGWQVARRLAASWQEEATLFIPAGLAGTGDLNELPVQPVPTAPLTSDCSPASPTLAAKALMGGCRCHKREQEETGELQSETGAAGFSKLSPPTPYLAPLITVEHYRGGLTPLLGRIFNNYRNLILIMAAGIAVRALAPHLVSKKTDPAVVVVDGGGRYAISLLSGHLGGANDLARRVAALLGGQAIITTASEARGLPPLDLVARELNMTVWPQASLTRVMAALVNDGQVDLLVEPPLLKSLAAALPSLEPQPLEDCPSRGDARAGIMVTWRRLPLPGRRWVYWRPQVISAGIGCRRGMPAAAILHALGLALREANLSRRSLASLATVDFKGREPGLQAAASRLRLPLRTFAPGELAVCIESHPYLQRSQAVERHIGIPGVCEPAAILAAGEGELLWPKQSYRGVTVALALAK